MIKSRRMAWTGHIARMGIMNAYMILVGEPEGKRPLGRSRHGWEDNNKIDLKETGCGGTAWIHLVQDKDQRRALVNTVMNLRVPQNVGEFLRAERLVDFERLSSMELVLCLQ
jgi:hypothetical protein